MFGVSALGARVAIMASCVAAVVLSFTSVAQENLAEGTAAPATECELHIWPAANFSSLPFGSGLAPGLARMFPGDVDESTNDQFTRLVTNKLQIEAIQRADIIASLGLPSGTQIIAHDETELDRVTKKRKERRSMSQVACYYELHIRSHYLIEDIVWGDRFATTFDFRQYSNQTEWDIRHRGEGGNKLTVFPIQEDDDPVEVLQEISAAIEANFTEYAPKVRRKLARKRR